MYEYRVILDRVVDGVTVDVDIDLGFDTWLSKQRIRLYGLDTWESRTRDLEEKKKGLEAKAFTKELLESDEGKFDIISHGVGKYGRVLGEIFIEGQEKSLNELLKDNGHAYEYDGGTKRPFRKIEKITKENLGE